MPETSPFEVLAEEFGAVAGRIERESALRITAAIADIARIDAQRELRLAQLEQRVIDRLGSVKDGAPGVDGAHGRDGANGRDGRDGVDGTAGDRGSPGENGKDGAAGRDGINGKDGAAGRDGTDGPAGERGAEGPAGKLPVVSEWTDGVHYEGAVVGARGGLFQALRDTGKVPGDSADWICLAAAGAAGKDGKDGRTPRVLATWSETDKHLALDIVVLNGAAFAARKDDPGACPGEGWQMISAQGKRGQTGERGLTGATGDSGRNAAPVIAAEIDGEGLLTLTNGDGSVVRCDLYPVLAKIAGGR